MKVGKKPAFFFGLLLTLGFIYLPSDYRQLHAAVESERCLMACCYPIWWVGWKNAIRELREHWDFSWYWNVFSTIQWWILLINYYNSLTIRFIAIVYFAWCQGMVSFYKKSYSVLESEIGNKRLFDISLIRQYNLYTFCIRRQGICMNIFSSLLYQFASTSVLS